MSSIADGSPTGSTRIPSTGIRPARVDDATAITRVRVDAWRHSYRGIVPDAFLDALDYSSEARRRRRIAAPQPDQVYLVYERDGEVAGFIDGGQPAPGGQGFAAEVNALYVHPAHHRSGIGRALLVAAAEHFARRGMRSLIIWTLRRGASRKFYEAMGGKLVRERHQMFRDRPDGPAVDLDEVAYGWDDLRAIAERA